MDGEEDETLVISHNTDVEVVDVWAVIRAVPSGMKIASSKLEKGITFLTNVHSQVGSLYMYTLLQSISKTLYWLVSTYQLSSALCRVCVMCLCPRMVLF